MARCKVIQLGEAHANTDEINMYKYTTIKRTEKGKECDDFSKKKSMTNFWTTKIHLINLQPQLFFTDWCVTRGQ